MVEIPEAKATMRVPEIGTTKITHAETSVTDMRDTVRVGEKTGSAAKTTGSAVEMAIKVPATEAVFPLTEVPTKTGPKIKDHAMNLSLEATHNLARSGIFPVRNQKIKRQKNFYPSHL